MTIDKYAHCDLSTGNDGTATIRSLDYGVSVNYNDRSSPANGSDLTILTAALKRFHLNHGIEMLVRSDSPPGSGLGSSSAMAVAAVGAVWRVLDLPFDLDAIARTAILVEREEAGIPGGRQDHYAAAYGGLNFIEFHKDRTAVQPVKIPKDLLEDLQSCLLLCFTGKRRPSANIINEQVQGYVTRRKEVVEALDCTKELAYRMRAALLAGSLDQFGQMLNEAWVYKRQFSDKVSNPEIDRMYERGLESGALGGKLLGAGAGGHMIFSCAESKRSAVAAALIKLGGEIVPFSFENEGLTTRLRGNGES